MEMISNADFHYEYLMNHITAILFIHLILPHRLGILFFVTQTPLQNTYICAKHFFLPNVDSTWLLTSDFVSKRIITSALSVYLTSHNGAKMLNLLSLEL